MSSTILNGDCLAILQTLEESSVDCCVTSPPYWGLRDYGDIGQIGRESEVPAYVSKLVAVFREVRRVLRLGGTLWLNLGDTYAANRSYQVPSSKGGAKHSPAQGRQASNKVPAGLKPKDLIGIPWRVAFALQQDGWYLRSEIIWHKPNAMPESVRDRPTRAHEHIFLLSKSEAYYYNADAVREPAANADKVIRLGAKSFSKRQATGANVMPSGNALAATYTVPPFKNKRSVWSIATKPYKGAHCAVFPVELPTTCILAGCPEGGLVLDPFCGSGTTGVAAAHLNRNFVGIDVRQEYCDLAEERLRTA